MKFPAVFLLNVVGIFLAFGFLIRRHVWPRLRGLPKEQALNVLILPHTFRFVGLSFLVPGVVSPLLPSEFAIPAAWGDTGAAVLAFVAIAAISGRWPLRLLFVWVFNLWGTIDLLYANYNGIALRIDEGLMGAAYYIPAVIVPLLLITHGLIFWILVRPSQQRQTVGGAGC
jgi:hypothetical protein